MNDRNPGYYAVIPASVRYDDSIPANAKLLYGEISALIGAEGYCFASNSYFAELYQLSERTISSLVAKLQTQGHITITLQRDSTGQIISRRLYLRDSAPESLSAPDGQGIENNFYTHGKYFREGIEKNCVGTVLSITNNKKENIKEKDCSKKSSRTQKDYDPLPDFIDWINEHFGEAAAAYKNALYAALARFSQSRKDSKKPIPSKSSITALTNKLLRYTAGSENQIDAMIDMLDTATAAGWRSVYPEKGNTASPKPGRSYEEL